MNNRLQQFLTLEQLSNAQFAEIMGIQRSTVTHILSGRNKPGFEFLQKFLMKFPSVNPDWLLLGRGKPLREMNSPAQSPTSEPVLDLDYESVDDTAPDSGTEPEDEIPQEMRREVRRITLFYSDGTFQEFYPPK